MIEQGPAAQSELFDLVFRHCASAAIRLAPPPASPALLPPHILRSDTADMPRRLLDHLPIFARLSEEERIQLAPKMKQRTHKAGDVLVEQGSVAQALFILTAGVLVAIQNHGEIKRGSAAPSSWRQFRRGWTAGRRRDNVHSKGADRGDRI